jgi:hypothetical protein
MRVKDNCLMFKKHKISQIMILNIKEMSDMLDVAHIYKAILNVVAIQLHNISNQ